MAIDVEGRCEMSELAGGDGIANPDVALRREAETLAQRFPEVDPGEIEDRVRSTYQRLKDDARVDSHLVAMTEGQVTEDLRRQGEVVHVRSENG
jgi:hypothetical protein